MTKAGEIRRDSIHLKEKTEYLRRKELVTGLEKDNFTRIFLFHSDGDWWKIIGKSVLYYKYLFAPRLKKTVNIREDDDYEYISKTGVIFIRDVKAVTMGAKRLGMALSPDSTDELVAICLNNRVTDEVFSKISRAEQADWDTVINMLIPKVLWPELSNRIRELQRIIRTITKNFPTDLKIVVGNGLLSAVMELNQILILGLNGMITPMECLEKLDEVNYQIMADLISIVNLQCTRPSKAHEAADICNVIKKLISTERRKEIRKANGTSRMPKRRSVITGEDDEIVPTYDENDKQTPRQIAEKSRESKQIPMEFLKEMAKTQK